MTIDESPERVLLEHATGRFGDVDPNLVVELALRAAQGCDLAVQRAAIEAMARRHEAVDRDELRVLARPGITGRTWTVGRRRGSGHDVAVSSLAPLRASCSCLDFARSSLGICKHVFVVLRALPKRWRFAPVQSRARLTFDPFQVASGDPDRLARVSVEGRAKIAGVVDGRVVANTLEARHAVLLELERRVVSGRLAAEPAAARVVTEELDRTDATLARQESREACERSLTELTRGLYGYQREGVLAFLRCGALLLADDMGLGKTTQAIAACHALLRGGAVERVLLVTPASLKPQWGREWRATSGEPLTLVDGPPARREAIYESTQRGALLVGYEQLMRDIDLIHVWDPEAVVLDEAQRIKNWATKSAAVVRRLSPRHRLALTGTPMENRLDELASIVDFVDDLALEPKWRLTPLHSISEREGEGGRGGARNLDLLRARLAPVMLRRHRREVVAQLPDRTDTRVPVELTAAQREEHDALFRPIARLVAVTKRRALRQEEFLRLMQLFTQQRMIANGLAQVRFEQEWPHVSESVADEATLARLSTPKLGALREIVRDLVIEQDRKVVVFSQWRAMLRLAEWSIRDVLRGVGKRAGFFTGAESTKQREQAVQDLHDDATMSVLFLTDAGGTGLNLQRAASACVQLELPWNPAVLEQRISRIHRPGQRAPIDVFHLVSEDSIESRIASLVGQKRAVFSALFDGTNDEVVFEKSTSFLSQMREIYDADAAIAAQAEEDAAVDVADAELAARGGAATGIEGQSARASLSTSNDAPATTATATSATASPPEELPVASHSASASIDGDATPFRVARTPSGGLRIDVAPAHADGLAALLTSLADALRRPTA